jgi:hypothetical protein
MSTRSSSPPIPCISYVQRLGGKRVRVFFNDGLVLETSLPTRTTPKRVRLLDDWGTGLRFGPKPSDEISSYALYVRRGRILRHGGSERLRSTR